MKIPWEEITVEIDRADRVRCEPGWHLQPGWGDLLTDFDLWFVWAGRGEMVTHSGPLVLTPGVCLWMRPGGRYEATHDPQNPLGVTYIHFDLIDRGSRKRIDPDWLPPEVHEVLHFTYFDAVARRIISLTREQALHPQGKVPEMAPHLLTALLMELEATPADGSDRLRDIDPHQQRAILRMVGKIHESPGATGSVHDLARQINYSPDHFSRVFKKVTGVTPREMIIHARMERARQLLQESILPIGRIADALGYENVFYFSRQFKERNGVTPTAFRRNTARKE